MRRPPWTLRMRLDREMDDRRYEIAFALDDFDMQESATASDMHLGRELGMPLVTFDQAVGAMKDRERRRAMLRSVAKQLAENIADYLEDREGWHGQERRERILENERTRR